MTGQWDDRDNREDRMIAMDKRKTETTDTIGHRATEDRGQI